MISDEERREAARRLRSVGLDDIRYSDAICEVMMCAGLTCVGDDDCHGSDERPECVVRVFSRLADLIEPSEGQNGPDASVDSGCGTRVDRGALLELADEMGSADPEDLDVAIDFVTECASRIREALGVWRWS